MGWQTVVEVALAVLGLFSTLVGFIVKSMQAEMKEMREKYNTHTDKISDIEVLVAGVYVTRQEMKQEMTEVNRKLDSIIDKIATKADR